MTDPAPKLEDEQPIAHHYAFVLIVEAVVLVVLWLLSRTFR